METWQVLIGLAVVAAVVFFVVNRKKGSVQAAVGGAEQAVQDALKQAIDKLHQSVPVKPSVPPVSPAPQIVPQEPIAPPVIATPPEPAPVAPAPYSGPFRDINGKPDPMGQYTEDSWRSAHDQQVLMNVRYYGPVPATSVTDDECLYLASVARDYPAKFYAALTSGEAAELAMVQYAVLSGTRDEVQRVINRTGSDLAAQFANYDPSTYSGRFVPLVEAVMTGNLMVKTWP